MLAVVMVLMMGVAIGEATGAAQLSFMPVTAYAAPGDDTTENSGTKTGGGLSDIKIGTDGTVSFGNEGADLNEVMGNGKRIVEIILSVCCLVCLAFLILSIVKFASSGDNDQARRKAMGGIITTGVGIALLGSVTIWYSFFYGAINGL